MSIQYATISEASLAALATELTAQAANGYQPVGGVLLDGGNYAALVFRQNPADYSVYVRVYVISDITIGTAGNGALKVAGDATANFPTGYRFTVFGSTSNDGVFTVEDGVGATYSGGVTTIPVNEAVVASVALGNIVMYAPGLEKA